MNIYKDGDIPAKDMLSKAGKKTTCKTWGLRIFAFLVSYVAIVVVLTYWIEWIELPLA